MKKIMLIAIGVCLINIGFTQQIVTDRPDQTESATVIPSRSFQLETGVLFEQQSSLMESEQTVLLPTSLFRIGVVKGFELRIVSQLESFSFRASNESEVATGFSDLELGFKAQLFKKENSFTEIAFLQHVILPTGSEGLTSNFFGSSSKLLISHELSESFAIGYNLGYYYLNSFLGDANYSFALSYSVSDNLSLYIESYGSIVEMVDFYINFDVGLAYLVKENFQLDFSFGTGINYNMNYLSLGFSWYVSKD